MGLCALSGMRRSGCRISQSTALILFAPRGFSTEGPSSTLSLARRSVWLDAQSPRGREHRILSIGELDGVMIAVAWTQRGADVCRIISVRRARDEEKRQYQQIHG